MALTYLAITLNLPKYITYKFKTPAITVLIFLILITGSSKGVLGLLIIFGVYFFRKYSFKKEQCNIPEKYYLFIIKTRKERYHKIIQRFRCSSKISDKARQGISGKN